jgi:hypothetical protein
MQPISRQRIGKHAPMATSRHITLELTVFSTRSEQSRNKEDNWGDPVSYIRTITARVHLEKKSQGPDAKMN